MENKPERRNVIKLIAAAAIGALAAFKFPSAKGEGEAIHVGDEHYSASTTTMISGNIGSNNPALSGVNLGSGVGMYGWSANGYGIHGKSTGIAGICGQSDYANTIPIVAKRIFGQTANLQEWQTSDGIALASVNKDGWLGVGTSSPERSIHLKGSNACFRMDRTQNSAAFILVRTTTGGTILKSFYVGVDASGVNNGEFFIGDVGNQVSGNSTKRLWIDNNGGVHIPDLRTGDVTFANGVVATEEGSGLAFKNESGEKIAVLDREGNLRIKGDVIKDPTL